MRKQQPPKETSHYPPGAIIASRYQVLQLLGWGSMGYVLKATDTLLNNEEVALKILFSQQAQDDVILARFRREVILARRLGHPNVVRVFDLGITETGNYFISMEFIEGVTLQKILSQRTLTVEEALSHILKIAQGLECAHEHTILHRDLKPTNILIQNDGTPKITDFGTAKNVFSAEKLTQADELIGTPLYISPEVIQKGEGDTRSDIYALGAMAFTVIEGQPPFFSPNWAVLAHMHVSSQVPDFKNENVPGWYVEMVNRCMAKDPNERFQTATELIRFIEKNTAKSQSVSRGAPSTSLLILVLLLGLFLGAAVGAVLS